MISEHPTILSIFGMWCHLWRKCWNSWRGNAIIIINEIMPYFKKLYHDMCKLIDRKKLKYIRGCSRLWIFVKPDFIKINLKASCFIQIIVFVRKMSLIQTESCTKLICDAFFIIGPKLLPKIQKNAKERISREVHYWQTNEQTIREINVIELIGLYRSPIFSMSYELIKTQSLCVFSKYNYEIIALIWNKKTHYTTIHKISNI